MDSANLNCIHGTSGYNMRSYYRTCSVSSCKSARPIHYSAWQDTYGIAILASDTDCIHKGVKRMKRGDSYDRTKAEQ